jgi:ribosomal protein S18 acetylase RimI-like enzyme
MISVRRGESTDADELVSLVLQSAPILLPYLFGSHKETRLYMSQAMLRPDGQYSAGRHWVAVANTKPMGCITLWDAQMPEQFHAQTLASLASVLNPQQLAHLVKINPTLSKVFTAPTINELCIGHLAVAPAVQGSGVGKKLIDHAINQAKILAKPRLILDVDISNDQAVNFYRACQFTETSEQHFEPTQQTFLRMTYIL